MFELKPLSSSAIPGALAKAERYRLLNEPQQCESICEDILAADPRNAEAKVMLVLAITDTFPHDTRGASRALEIVATLPSDYDRSYFSGLVAERRGRALLQHQGHSARAAAEWLHEAMRHFERADALSPPDNDDAKLRWNSIARTLNARRDLGAADDAETSPVMSE